MKNKFIKKYLCCLLFFFYRYITFHDKLFGWSRLWISYKIFFFVSKINENCRSLQVKKILIFLIFGLFYFLIPLKAGSVMSEVAILLVSVFAIAKYSTSLLKCLLQISASSSLVPIVLFLLFKVINSLWKAISKKTGTTIFQNFLLSEISLWSTFPWKTSFSFGEQANTEKWRLKGLLYSSFPVFKNLFLIIRWSDVFLFLNIFFNNNWIIVINYIIFAIGFYTIG